MRIFDYTKFADPLRDEIRETFQSLARENGLDIEFVTKKTGRKEARIRKVLETPGDHPGLVHILLTMGSCRTY